MKFNFFFRFRCIAVYAKSTFAVFTTFLGHLKEVNYLPIILVQYIHNRSYPKGIKILSNISGLSRNLRKSIGKSQRKRRIRHGKQYCRRCRNQHRKCCKIILSFNGYRIKIQMEIQNRGISLIMLFIIHLIETRCLQVMSFVLNYIYIILSPYREMLQRN